MPVECRAGHFKKSHVMNCCWALRTFLSSQSARERVMDMPEFPQADRMSEGEQACCCFRMSSWEATARAAPGIGPARKHQPCSKAERRSKAHEEARRGCLLAQGQGVSLRSPRLWGTQPRSSAPHLRLQRMPRLSPKPPNSPGHPWKGKMKQGSLSLFKTSFL